MHNYQLPIEQLWIMLHTEPANYQIANYRTANDSGEHYGMVKITEQKNHITAKTTCGENC
jgi:hypothetical protein